MADRRKGAKLRKLKTCCLNIISILLLGAYTAAGAVLFLKIEGPATQRVRYQAEEKRLAILQNFTKALQTDYPALSGNTLNESISQFEIEYTEYLSSSRVPEWNVITAVFFAGSLYTTTGFSNVAPITLCGRLLSIVYVLFGVPLLLFMLNERGKSTYRLLRNVWACCGKRLNIDSGLRPKPAVPVVLVLAIASVFWMICASGIFFVSRTEWDYPTSLYYSLLSFTTTGFGNVFPKESRTLLITLVSIVMALSFVATVYHAVKANQRYMFWDIYNSCESLKGLDVATFKVMLRSRSLKDRILYFSMDKTLQEVLKLKWQSSLGFEALNNVDSFLERRQLI